MLSRTICALLFAGTTTLALAADRAAPPVDRVEKISRYFLSPEIGERSTAEVGDTLYREGTQTNSTTYFANIKSDARSTMDNGYVLDVKGGAGGPMLMRRPGNLPMLCFITKRTGMAKFFGDSNVHGCLIDTDDKMTFRYATFANYAGLFKLDQPVEYEVKTTETLVESRGDFYVEVLYQGLSKGEIKISYREFANGLARPAFTQDVTYELEADGTTTIGFKGLRLKVLRATNQNIEYVLEQTMPSLAKFKAELQEQKNQKAKPFYQ